MTENVQSRCASLSREFLRTSEQMAAEQMVGFFDPYAIIVNSQEQLATSDIWRPFVCHPKTEAAR